MLTTPGELQPASRVRYVGGRHPIISQGDEAYIAETSRPSRIIIGFRGFQLHVPRHDIEAISESPVTAP